MADPDMSVFMPSIPSTGFTCRPPVSKVMPLPTSTTRGVAAVAPAGSWSRRTSRAAWPSPDRRRGCRRSPRGAGALVPDPDVEAGAPGDGAGLARHPGGVLGVRRGVRQAAGEQLGPGPGHRPRRPPSASAVPVTTASAAGGDDGRSVLAEARRGPRREHGRLDVGRRATSAAGRRADGVDDAAPVAGRAPDRGRRPRQSASEPSPTPTRSTRRTACAPGAGDRGDRARRSARGSWVASTWSASRPRASRAARAPASPGAVGVADDRDEGRAVGRRLARRRSRSGPRRGRGARSRRRCGG